MIQEYDGFYLWYTGLAKRTRHFFIERDAHGGWGGLTMGLFSPAEDYEKSYGLYG